MRLTIILLILFISNIPCNSQSYHFSELSSSISTYKPQQVLFDVSISTKLETLMGRGGLGFSAGYSPINHLHFGMHYRNGSELSDISISSGVYKSWYLKNEKSFLYHNVFSLNAHAGYKRSKGLFVQNFTLTQNSLFLKIGGLLYYNGIGLNMSYKVFGVQTQKIYVGPFDSDYSTLAFEFKNNPKFYSMLDLRFSIKFKRIQLFIHRQQLFFPSIDLLENRRTIHLGFEYNMSPLFYPHKKLDLFFE